jgi:hypothetical protein
VPGHPHIRKVAYRRFCCGHLACIFFVERGRPDERSAVHEDFSSTTARANGANDDPFACADSVKADVIQIAKSGN